MIGRRKRLLPLTLRISMEDHLRNVATKEMQERGAVAHSVAPVRGTPRPVIHLLYSRLHVDAYTPCANDGAIRTSSPFSSIAAQFCIVCPDGIRAFSLYHTLPVGSGALGAGAFVSLVDGSLDRSIAVSMSCKTCRWRGWCRFLCRLFLSSIASWHVAEQTVREEREHGARTHTASEGAIPDLGR